LGIDFVAINNLQGVLDAVQHLLNDGHKVIGGLFGSLKSSTRLERYQGFRRAAALKRNDGLTFHAETDLRSESDAYRAMNSLLDLPNPPTAVFTDNSEMAQGALRAAKTRGIVIPGELGLISFGDMDLFQIYTPPISVVSIPVEPLGRRAAELLFDRIQSPEGPRSKVELQANLIIRQSCSRRHQD
jgi:DNA-binding LacI/PurR family transcriptional regulator